MLEGHEVVGVEQDADGVTLTVQDVDSGKQRRLRGKYLVGADGAHSKVRELLDIPFDGRGVFSNSITIYFRADLTRQLLGKPLSVIYINNPVLGGFFRMEKNCTTGFLVVNTVGDPKVDPRAAADAAADVSEKRLIELVRVGAGVPDLPVKIDGVARWRATSDVARRFQEGRVFLAGDAAHLMPPNGGFGGNTGIHDAHNLAWKLALVLKGVAGPELLDTYEVERKPVGKFTVEQAYTRYVTRTATYLGAKDFQPPANDFNIELGYLYRSPGNPGGERRGQGACTTTRASHSADPARGLRTSGSIAPATGSRRSICSAARSSCLQPSRAPPGARPPARRPAVSRDSSWRPIAWEPRLCAIPTCAFQEAYGLSGAGAVLVRPDGFVAWRAKSATGDLEATMAQTFAALLGKPEARRPN